MSGVREAASIVAAAALGAGAFALVVLLERHLTDAAPSALPEPRCAAASSCCTPGATEQPAAMPKRMQEMIARKEAEKLKGGQAPPPDEMPKRMQEAIARRESAKIADVPPPAEMPKRMQEAIARKEVAATVAGTVKPALGAVMQLSKETCKTRDQCRAALIASDNNYDAAKASLMPDAMQSIAPNGTKIDGVFEPAAKFEGGRSGWMFKSGVYGLGYYRELSLDPLAAGMPSTMGG